MQAPSLPPNVTVLSRLDDAHDGFDLSEERFLKALSSAEEAHFWHTSRNRFIEQRLRACGVAPPARVLELGCGGGCVSAALARAGYRVTGVDGHVRLVCEAARRAPQASFYVHDLAQGTAAIPGGEHDAVAFFDVLEHLDDPASAIEAALPRVRGGGVVVGTVPALMALWSQVDVQAGHRLRYDEEGLRAMLSRVRGASIVEVAPFNRLLVPMLWLQRRMVVKGDAASTSESNLRVPPAPINRALYAALRAEHRLARAFERTHLPGSSLWFCLVRG